MARQSAPLPWSWEAYEGWLKHEWPALLLKHSHDEKAVHAFLEQHPCLLPGGEADNTSLGGHHGPSPGAVITEPPLPGTFQRKPDFIWPTKHSGVFRPVLLELERPSKRWFRQDGQQTKELTQVIHQVAQWRTWLESEGNKHTFYGIYGISEWIRRYHKVQPVYALVYGRRDEFVYNEFLSLQRESIRPDWLQWMTYDRLSPVANARNWVTVKVSAKVSARAWEVVAVPPTFEPPA